MYLAGLAERDPSWYLPVVSFVDLNRLPTHVAIIMDGNGRWAQRRGEHRTAGHAEGSKAVRRTVRAARRLGIPALTLYAFSEQNWQRPDREVTALMALLVDYLSSERQELLDNGIALKAIGRLDRLPDAVRLVLDPLIRDTACGTDMTLTLALSYGGREELTDVVNTLVADGITVDTEALSAALPSMASGPVDLLIRTGGEQRISNFLLWGCAYAEFVFSDALWPDFDAAALCDAVCAYQKRERRFGEVPSDIGVGRQVTK